MQLQIVARSSCAAIDAAATIPPRFRGVPLRDRHTDSDSGGLLKEVILTPEGYEKLLQEPTAFAARNKPRVWFPYGKQHRVLYHQTECWGCGLETCILERKRCLTSITVDEVVTEVRAILG